MELLYSIRTALVLAFMALPLLLIGFIGFTAIGLGNLSFFVLFAGQVLAVPLATYLSHSIVKAATGGVSDMFYVPSSDIGQLVPSAPYFDPVHNVAPSFWMAHVMFFLGYLGANAYTILRLPASKDVNEAMVESRQSKAVSMLTILALTAVVLPMLRYYLTGSETVPGMLVAYTFFSALGVSWYMFAELCGARAADVFGVVQQILPSGAKDEAPMTCVYAPKP